MSFSVFRPVVLTAAQQSCLSLVSSVQGSFAERFFAARASFLAYFSVSSLIHFVTESWITETIIVSAALVLAIIATVYTYETVTNTLKRDYMSALSIVNPLHAFTYAPPARPAKGSPRWILRRLSLTIDIAVVAIILIAGVNVASAAYIYAILALEANNILQERVSLSVISQIDDSIAENFGKFFAGRIGACEADIESKKIS